MTATIDHVNGHMPDDPYPSLSYTEQAANADATRLKAAADAEAARLKAQADAQARATAQAVKDAKAAAEIAQHQAEAEEIRLASAEKTEAAAKQRAAKQEEERARQAEKQRREELATLAEKRARQLVTVSVLIALPLQLVAFWLMNPALIIVPLGLEYAAWVMLAQVDAAVAEKRRAWHYVAATLLVATFAAWMNWSHGPDLIADHGELVGAVGAFFSLLGPATWALHTHGKIAKREGRPTRAARRAAAKAAAAAKREAEQQQAVAEREAAQLDERRRREHPEVYERAAYIASASGLLSITEQVWKRAWWDVMGEGAELGETAESIATRLAATAALREARIGDETPLPVVLQDGRIRVYRKPASPKVTTQIPPAREKAADRPKPTPPKRQKGDTPAYSPLARSAASETAKRAAKK